VVEFEIGVDMKTVLAVAVVLLAYFFATDAHAISHDEKRCIADSIYHEARGEPLEGKIAVANVIVNRMNSRHFPNTACKVVWQRKQFSWTLYRSKHREIDDYGNKNIERIAELALKSKLVDVTGGATHYHANYVNPSWAPTKTKTSVIGNHIFYRWK
jgi:N-acetylmuramoyl-L-alanine amidase